MSKSDTFEADVLKLIFNATAIANLADNAGSSPLGNLYVSLHTADPLDAGAENANETVYTNYARVAVARTTGGWTVSGTNPTKVANAAAINFPACGVTGATITHVGVGVGTTAGNADKMLYSGQLTAPLVVSAGITPSFAIGALAITED